MVATLPQRRLLVLSALALALVLGAASGLRAERPDPGGLKQASAALQRAAGDLAASHADARRQAFSQLSQLDDDALPLLEARLSAVLAVRPSREEAQRVLTALRHATGSRRADDVVDLARGVLPLLEKERSPAVLAVVEPLLYLRAIEAATTTEMQLQLSRFAGLDEGAWDGELVAVRRRAGVQLLPAFIMLRSHASPAVRRFAQASVVALGMEDPAVALATSDSHLLSRLLRAYGSPPEYAAMPLIARMVADTRMEVRSAARFALSRFGKNAIWQVRELYEEVSGQTADRSWSFERSAEELYTVLDRAEIEEAATLLSRGEKSLLADDLVTMQRAYDTLLAKYPDFADKAKLAPGYAALGAAREAADDLEGALAAYQRAARLDPASKDIARVRGQIAYLSAELSLSQGVVDLPGYERALAADPTLERAAEAKDRLSGETKRRADARKRWAAIAALVLLLALVAFALRSRPSASDEPERPEATA